MHNDPQTRKKNPQFISTKHQHIFPRKPHVAVDTLTPNSTTARDTMPRHHAHPPSQHITPHTQHACPPLKHTRVATLATPSEVVKVIIDVQLIASSLDLQKTKEMAEHKMGDGQEHFSEINCKGHPGISKTHSQTRRQNTLSK